MSKEHLEAKLTLIALRYPEEGTNELIEQAEAELRHGGEVAEWLVQARSYFVMSICHRRMGSDTLVPFLRRFETAVQRIRGETLGHPHEFQALMYRNALIYFIHQCIADVYVQLREDDARMPGSVDTMRLFWLCREVVEVHNSANRFGNHSIVRGMNVFDEQPGHSRWRPSESVRGRPGRGSLDVGWCGFNCCYPMITARDASWFTTDFGTIALLNSLDNMYGYLWQPLIKAPDPKPTTSEYVSKEHNKRRCSLMTENLLRILERPAAEMMLR